jgi:hypothetical protein
MMSVNAIGAALGAAWIGLGTLVICFLLRNSTLLDNAKWYLFFKSYNVKQNFKYIAPFSILAGACIGWIGGPIIVPVILGEF